MKCCNFFTHAVVDLFMMHAKQILTAFHKLQRIRLGIFTGDFKFIPIARLAAMPLTKTHPLPCLKTHPPFPFLNNFLLRFKQHIKMIALLIRQLFRNTWQNRSLLLLPGMNLLPHHRFGFIAVRCY